MSDSLFAGWNENVIKYSLGYGLVLRVTEVRSLESRLCEVKSRQRLVGSISISGENHSGSDVDEKSKHTSVRIVGPKGT